MSDTVFVLMYHPALGNREVLAPLQAVATYATHGWLLVDPNATPPPVATPYLTQSAADSRYLRDWAPAETVTGGAIRLAPDGRVIVRTVNGTTRATYDSTEQAAWTSTTGGSSGGSSSYVFAQSTPAATWSISHSFGRLPSVALFVGGELVEADVTADSSTVHVTFPAPTAGSAILT